MVGSIIVYQPNHFLKTYTFLSVWIFQVVQKMLFSLDLGRSFVCFFDPYLHLPFSSVLAFILNSTFCKVFSSERKHSFRMSTFWCVMKRRVIYVVPWEVGQGFPLTLIGVVGQENNYTFLRHLMYNSWYYEGKTHNLCLFYWNNIGYSRLPPLHPPRGPLGEKNIQHNLILYIAVAGVFSRESLIVFHLKHCM